jgi:hypothetical protein
MNPNLFILDESEEGKMFVFVPPNRGFEDSRKPFFAVAFQHTRTDRVSLSEPS